MTASATSPSATETAEPLRFTNHVEITQPDPSAGRAEVFVTFSTLVPIPGSEACQRDVVARLVMTREMAWSLKRELRQQLIGEDAQFGIDLDANPVLKRIWDNDDDAIYDEG